MAGTGDIQEILNDAFDPVNKALRFLAPNGSYAALASPPNGPVLSAMIGTDNEGFGAGALASPSLTGNYNTAAGQAALQSNTTGTQNTAAGQSALQSNATGSNNTAAGQNALLSNTTGSNNPAAGFAAGYTATAANATTTAVGQTLIGFQSGQATATQVSYIAALGYQALVTASGGVAIGTDHTGAGAVSVLQDEIALGTALHQVRINNVATGAGTAALGANSPAVTPGAPYTWFKMLSSDGSTVYVPCWK